MHVEWVDSLRRPARCGLARASEDGLDDFPLRISRATNVRIAAVVVVPTRSTNPFPRSLRRS